MSCRPDYFKLNAEGRMHVIRPSCVLILLQIAVRGWPGPWSPPSSADCDTCPPLEQFTSPKPSKRFDTLF